MVWWPHIESRCCQRKSIKCPKCLLQHMGATMGASSCVHVQHWAGRIKRRACKRGIANSRRPKKRKECLSHHVWRIQEKSSFGSNSRVGNPSRAENTGWFWFPLPPFFTQLWRPLPSSPFSLYYLPSSSSFLPLKPPPPVSSDVPSLVLSPAQ